MAHHKRRRPKQSRSGCLYCKPYKGNGCVHKSEDMRFGVRRHYESGRGDMRCEGIAQAGRRLRGLGDEG